MISVKDAHLLERCFGRWPDFRGAVVSSVRLFAPRNRPAQLELNFEVVELFLDAHGVYRDRQRCLTTLSFTNVLGARMEIFRPFRQEGVVDALELIEHDGDSSTIGEPWGGRRYRVRLVPMSGFPDAQFFCDQVAILKALSIARESPER